MKKVLYIGESYLGYEKIVKKLIEKVLKYEVIYIDLSKYKYSYKNIFERIYAKIFFQLIKRKNYKKEKMIEKLIKDVKKVENKIDIIFYIKPTDRMEKFIKYLYNLKKEMIYHQWDSLRKTKDSGKCIKYFNKASTYDENDARKLNIKFVPNFYIEENKKDVKIEYDVFGIISHGKNGKRITEFENIAKRINDLGLVAKFLVYTKEKSIKSKYFTVIDKPISIRENYEYMNKSKVVLEIGDTFNQRGGVTFRAIDSLGLGKKLITNCEVIKNYDFYNKNNIFIINQGNIDIPLEFFKTPYEKVEQKIYKEYSGESWIKEIFGVN